MESVTSCGANGATCGGCGEGANGCASGGCQCNGGAACSGKTCCSSGCANLMTDAANCGACGRTCPGGTCTGGACQATTLGSISDGTDLNGITVVGSTVCVSDADDGDIFCLPATGGMPTVSVSGQNGPYWMATDGTNLYWTDDDASSAFGRVEENGSVLSGSEEGAAVIAVTSSGLAAWDDSMEDTIRAYVGGTAVTVASGQNNPTSVAVSGTSVFWTSFTTSPGTIAVCANVTSTGCSTSIQTLWQVAATSLATDSTYVYWTLSTTPGGVFRCAQSGCVGNMATQIYSGGQPVEIVTDATNVYFSDSSNNTIEWCPVTGCPGNVPNLLAANAGNPPEIALDASSLYWTNAATVLKAAKP
jgi:hypothetical protein